MNKIKLNFYFIPLLILITGQVNAQEYSINSFNQNVSIFRASHNTFLQKFSLPPYIISSLQNNRIYKLSSGDLRMDSVIICSVSGDSVKMFLEYNISGSISGYFSKFKSSGNWFNYFAKKFSYDENGNLIRTIDLSWNGIKWDSVDCTNNYFDAQGYMLKKIVQFYTDSIWTNSILYTYSHDSLGIIVDTTKIYQWNNNQWYKNMFYATYYSVKNRKDSILYYNWDGSEWLSGEKTNYYYTKILLDWIPSLLLSGPEIG